MAEEFPGELARPTSLKIQSQKSKLKELRVDVQVGLDDFLGKINELGEIRVLAPPVLFRILAFVRVGVIKIRSPPKIFDFLHLVNQVSVVGGLVFRFCGDEDLVPEIVDVALGQRNRLGKFFRRLPYILQLTLLLRF